MADPFSVAAGAIGVASLAVQLLGGCIKGFVILSTAHNFSKDASTITCMLHLQEIQLVEWAKRAGLLTGDGTLDHRLNARAIEATLSQLQTLLLDTEKLKKIYGLDIRSKAATMPHEGAVIMANVDPGVALAYRDHILIRSQIAESQTTLRRLWWAIADKEKMEKFVTDIQALVRELWHLLDPWRQDDILASTEAIATNMASLNHRFDQLIVLSEALATMRTPASDRANQSIDRLSTSARIRAYRLGLDERPDVFVAQQDSSLPSPQRLYEGLENLAASSLRDYVAITKSGSMGLARYQDEVVFVEEKPITVSMAQQSLARAKSLAALLNLPKHHTFGSLMCRGIIEEPSVVKFVFRHPCSGSSEKPRSLVDLFHHRDGIKPPSLTVRIQLAQRIARTVQDLHRAGWLHKSLRSEHVLFFPASKDTTIEEMLAEPLLAGFAFSRFNSPTEISEQPSIEPKLDIYRHPLAMGEPSISFSTEMDVYSLGTILLEIAEWRGLRHLVDSVVDVGLAAVPLSQLAQVRSFLLKGVGRGGTSKLRERTGDIYASACLMCLGGKVIDPKEEERDTLGDSPTLLDVVVERLKRCRI